MALLRAVRSGNADTLRHLVERHQVDVNKRLESGETLLHLAIDRGNSTIVQVLLDSGADVDSPSRYGESPLHQASSRGLVEVVKALLTQDADVNAVLPSSGESNLHLAARGGHADVLEFLLQHGAKINAASRLRQTPLHVATSSSSDVDLSVFRKLLEKGAEVNSPGCRLSPLHLAVERGDPRMVRLLLQAGADVNAQDPQGVYPLHKAAEAGNPDIVSVLLQYGAKVNSKGRLLEEVRPWIGERRHSALHIAVSQGHVHLAELLLQNGAEVDQATADYRDEQSRPWCWIVHKETALHLAADGGNAALVRLLTRHGASLGNVDVDGNMPHHLALHGGHLAALHALLLRGCLINARDGDGRPALHQAIRIRDYESVQLLLMHGCSVSPRRKMAASVVQMLAADPACPPAIFQALFYSGNTSAPVLHHPEEELFPLKASSTRRYIYEWLCSQDAHLQPLKVLCRWRLRRLFRDVTNIKSIWIFVDNLRIPAPLKRYLLLDEFSDLEVDYEVCPVIAHPGTFSFSAPPICFGFNY